MNGPIKNIPNNLIDLYTLNGKIPIYDFYLEENNKNKIVWKDEFIETIKTHYTKDNIMNNKHQLLSRWKHGGEPYPDHRIGGACQLLQQSFNKYSISEKSIAIVGSTTPWIECMCMNNNAQEITTVEYNIPQCNDNRIKMMDYYLDFQRNETKFDCIISYSSIEHSGLGRYGDILDPEGDFKTMSDIYENLNDNGLLFLGVPVGPDAVCWNANRIYGEIRLPLLLEKFEVLEWFGCTFEQSQQLPKGKDWRSNYQPVIVLKKRL